MTVESNPFPLRYSGDGSTTVFTVSAYFLNEEDVGGAHLRVTSRTGGGVETILVENTDYTVTGAGDLSGGYITLAVAPSTGETLVINRNVPATQRTDYQSYDSFPAESHERALDKITMKLQQTSTEVSRSIMIAETDSASITTTLPTAELRAGKALIFDSSGNVTISTNDYADIEAQQDILEQTEAARNEAQGYAIDAAEYYDLVVAAPVIAAAATVDRFSGDGTTTGFTLSVTPLNEDNTNVFISGVYQQKDTYSVTGTTLTFSEAPPVGTDNIEVSSTLGYAIGTPSDDTISTAKVIDGAVTFSKMQNINTDRLLGRESSGSGVIEEIELGTGLELTGLTLELSSGGVGTSALANNGVTVGKLQQIATASVLGRATAGTGDVEVLGIGTGLGVSGGNLVATGAGTGDMLKATYDGVNVNEQLIGVSASQTMTNKTLTSPVINGNLTGTAIADEDNMASNSATLVPTQQSVKAYVDTGLATKANTSHTQASSTITDFQEAVEDVIGSAITAGTNISVSYSDATGKTTINAALAGGGSDIIGLKSNYSATGDGVTNDTTAVNAAISAAKRFYVPDGVYDTTLTPSQLTVPFWGDGRIRDSSDNYRGRYFSLVDAAPASTASRDSVNTAFNGDMSGVQFPVEHRITGSATLGNPTSGYLYTHETYPHYTHLRNESGHNQSTTSNSGRTAACAYQVKIDQHGQGDAVAYNALVYVTGTKAGSTNFLANPAGSFLNGSIQAGAAGVYLNTLEFDMQDGGFDCAGIGTTTNLLRTISTGAKSAVWIGHRVQSNGTVAADVAYSASGLFKRGLDLVPVTLDAINAAISLKANQRIYFNSSSVAAGNLEAGWFGNVSGSEFIDYDSASGSMRFVVGHQAQIQLYGSASQILFVPNGITSRARANNSSFDVVSDFKVASSLGGSNYFRASASEVNCSVQLKVNNTLDIYSPTTKGSATSAGVYLRIKVNGTDYYLQLFN